MDRAREQDFFCYRGAAALNNMGVALLQQRAFRQAVATFKDAVQAMKPLLHEPDSTDPVDCNLLQSKIDKASRRLAKPRVYPASGVGTDVVACEDILLKAAWRGIRYSTSAHYHTVRIETSNGTTLPDTEDTAVEIAIVLYNLGVAYMCLQTDVSLESERRKFFVSIAMEIFNVAYLALFKTQGVEGCGEDAAMTSKAMAVAMLALAGRMLSQLALRHKEHAKQSRRLLEELEDSLVELEFVFEKEVLIAAAAAA